MTELKYMGFEQLLSFIDGLTRDLTVTLPQPSNANETTKAHHAKLDVQLADPHSRAALERMVKWAMEVSQGTGPRTQLAGLKWAERHPEVFAQLFDPREFFYRHLRDYGLPMVLNVPRLLALLEPAERLPFIEAVFERHFVLGDAWVRGVCWAGMRPERVAQLVMEQIRKADTALAEDDGPFKKDAKRDARMALLDFLHVGPGYLPYERTVVPAHWGMLSRERLSWAMFICARWVPTHFLCSESFGPLLKTLERAFGRDVASEQIGKILDEALRHVADLARVTTELMAPETSDQVPAVLSKAAKKTALKRVGPWGTPIEVALWLALSDDELFFGLEQLGVRGLPVAVVADFQTAWASCKYSKKDPKIAEMVRMHPERVARIDAFMAQLARENGCFIATVESGRHGTSGRMCVHEHAAGEDVCWEQHPWALSYELHEGDVVLVNRNCPTPGSDGRVAAFIRPIRPKR